MPRKQLEKVLVAELGDFWRQKVADFEYEPLAAASIGQVSMLLNNRVLPAAVIIEPRLVAIPCQAEQSILHGLGLCTTLSLHPCAALSCILSHLHGKVFPLSQAFLASVTGKCAGAPCNSP